MVERRGLYTGNGDAMRALSEAECAEIDADSREWILLFQMGSLEEEGCELSFCDGGIYFYIRRDDLARRDFSHVWLVLQTG